MEVNLNNESFVQKHLDIVFFILYMYLQALRNLHR